MTITFNFITFTHHLEKLLTLEKIYKWILYVQPAAACNLFWVRIFSTTGRFQGKAHYWELWAPLRLLSSRSTIEELDIV